MYTHTYIHTHIYIYTQYDITGIINVFRVKINVRFWRIKKREREKRKRERYRVYYIINRENELA